MTLLALPARWRSAALAACALTAAADASAQESAGATEWMLVVPYDAETTEFVPLVPGYPDGPQIAPLWGDRETGPSTFLFRVARDYGGLLHTHSADYHLVMLEGTWKHWGEGGSEEAAEELGLGSYWYQPANEVHTDNCLRETCVAFMKFEGPNDLIPAEQ